MFVRNDTTERISLAKGHLADGLAVGAIVVERVYRVLEDGLERADDAPQHGRSHPPDTSRVVLWSEVSVTASGTAFGPRVPPHVCPVSLVVGQEAHRLIVFGPRRFQRALDGELEPSKPAPFDGVPIGWERAFGGGYSIPPGLDPASGLPHPGARAHHPLNPLGVGFYADKRAATDQPLPDVERPDQLIKRWNDQPTPAGFSPCPELHGLRLPARYGGRGRDFADGSKATDPREAMMEDASLVALRMQHHAPGELVFHDVPASTPIALTGLGRRPLRFEVPASPICVCARRRRQEHVAPPRLRSVHVDADTGTVTVVYGHDFPYDPARPPSWIIVTPTP